MMVDLYAMNLDADVGHRASGHGGTRSPSALEEDVRMSGLARIRTDSRGQSAAPTRTASRYEAARPADGADGTGTTKRQHSSLRCRIGGSVESKFAVRGRRSVPVTSPFLRRLT